MTKTQVLIVGAGPTGLVLALWLTRRGVHVRVIDKTAEPGTTSRAVGVQARTLEFYQQLGLAGAVVDAGLKVPAVNLWVGGAKRARLPLGNIGEGLSPFPYLLIYPQDEHERLLIAQLDALGVHVEHRTDLLRFAENDDSVHAALALPDGSEESCEAMYLAGCDGAHSTVRQALQIGFPGGTYAALFYVADVSASGPAMDRELNVDIEDSDFLAVFPLQGTGRARLIGTVRDLPDAGTRALTFADVSKRAIEQLRLGVEKVNWFSTYRVHHRVADGFRKGRTFLLGDAAHLHSPVGAQGMNTGIGDAVNLAWKLAAVVKGEAAASLLDSYEPERIGFARRLVATTDRAFTLVTKRGAIARWVRTLLVPALVPRLFHLAALPRFAFRTASQIGVQYRDSALSVGAAGDVHGGDRLPWIPISTGTDNFSPLASMRWQVHVYGAQRAGVESACAALALPLHIFAWTDSMSRAGVMRSACYLVRPDGYVALADLKGDAAGLGLYFAERGIRLPSTAQ